MPGATPPPAWGLDPAPLPSDVRGFGASGDAPPGRTSAADLGWAETPDGGGTGSAPLPASAPEPPLAEPPPPSPTAGAPWAETARAGHEQPPEAPPPARELAPAEAPSPDAPRAAAPLIPGGLPVLVSSRPWSLAGAMEPLPPLSPPPKPGPAPAPDVAAAATPSDVLTPARRRGGPRVSLPLLPTFLVLVLVVMVVLVVLRLTSH